MHIDFNQLLLYHPWNGYYLWNIKFRIAIRRNRARDLSNSQIPGGLLTLFSRISRRVINSSCENEVKKSEKNREYFLPIELSNFPVDFYPSPSWTQFLINIVVHGNSLVFPPAADLLPRRWIYTGCVVVTLLKPLFSERRFARACTNFHAAAYIYFAPLRIIIPI